VNWIAARAAPDTTRKNATAMDIFLIIE
jgi:hypothetical protein